MLKSIAKISIAAIIIWWLISNDRIDFSLFIEIFNYPLIIIVTFLILLFNANFTAYRWKMLLQIHTEKKLPIFKTIMINWIGLFFNSVLPGAVSGDLIKVFYAQHLDIRLTKSITLASVIIDRIIGLIGLIILMGMFSIVRFSTLTAISPSIEKIVYLNFLLFGGAICFIAIILLPISKQKIITGHILKIPILGTLVTSILNKFWIFGSSTKTILITIIMSIFTQGMGVFSFWLLSSPFTTNISIWDSFSIIPIGMITVAIPISPGGLGVGHAAYDMLFQYFNESSGASIFNLFFTILFIINLIGIIPYIALKKSTDR